MNIKHYIGKVITPKSVGRFTLSDGLRFSGREFNDDKFVVLSVAAYYGYAHNNVEPLCLNIQLWKPNYGAVRFSAPLDYSVKASKDDSVMGAYRKYILENFNNTSRFTAPIGSDPEIFVQDENEKVIPAFNFLGSKEFPTKGGQNNVYWDGFQCEFDTVANTCLAYHCDAVHYGLKTLYKAALEHNPKATLSSQPTMDIDINDLRSAHDEHVQFGCMPSFNIYGHKGIECDGREVPFRSAGGHIHFGAGHIGGKALKNVVKSLDAILGVACVSLFAAFDSPLRRTMYGLAGEYRLPRHGLEYRTLSNAWIIHPLIMHMVFELARRAYRFGELGLLDLWKATEEETIHAINKCDVKLAREILERNKDMFITILRATPMGEECYKIFMNGLETVVLNTKDIAGNWMLKPEQVYTGHSGGVGKCIAYARDKILKGEKVS